MFGGGELLQELLDVIRARHLVPVEDHHRILFEKTSYILFKACHARDPNRMHMSMNDEGVTCRESQAWS